MGPFDLLLHTLNFAAPAFGMAVLMLGFNAVLNRQALPKRPAVAQFAVNLGVGLAVLSLGLWIFGRDGMMATYGALVLFVATSQWALTKPWRH